MFRSEFGYCITSTIAELHLAAEMWFLGGGGYTHLFFKKKKVFHLWFSHKIQLLYLIIYTSPSQYYVPTMTLKTSFEIKHLSIEVRIISIYMYIRTYKSQIRVSFNSNPVGFHIRMVQHYSFKIIEIQLGGKIAWRWLNIIFKFKVLRGY